MGRWNTHLFCSDTVRFPIHPKAFYTPNTAAFPSDPAKEYADDMRKRGVDRCVVVSPW